MRNNEGFNSVWECFDGNEEQPKGGSFNVECEISEKDEEIAFHFTYDQIEEGANNEKN